nr:CoA-substrate-specific enzyme activase [Candidatus Caldarchaeum subterraneum]
MEDGEKIIALDAAPSGYKFDETASKLLQSCIDRLGLKREDIAMVITTGFGRYRIQFRDLNVTELTAHAKGAKYFFPETRTVVDVGAGNSRVSKIDSNGKVTSFRVSDKCAAGGGGFLEKIAYYSGLEVDKVGDIAIESRNPIEISTVCSIFAESEVINLMTQEVPLPDILMGAHRSLVGRISVMVKALKMEPEVTLTGGLVRNKAFVKALEEKLGLKVNADERLYYSGAVGAAILAWRRLLKKGMEVVA